MSKQFETVQMSDIARLAGVSKSTVSRALADSPLVNETTKALVREVAERHNYRVNVAARNFRLKESLTVALVMPAAAGVEWRISDPFFLEMTAAVAEALDERGHQLLLTRTTPQSGEWLEEFVAKRLADGLILIGQGTQHGTIERIARSYRGISVWGSPVSGASYPVVGSDNYLGGLRATEHLIGRGCRHIALVGYREDPEIRARYMGYREALAAAGLSCDEALTFGTVAGSATGKDTLSQLVAAKGRFDGVFAVSDLQAVKLMTALLQQGVSIPDECAVVGYDDLPIATWYHPALTTVHQSREMGAQILVDNLLAAIEGRDTVSVKLDPELIVRGSA